jgi:hypothetical protein
MQPIRISWFVAPFLFLMIGTGFVTGQQSPARRIECRNIAGTSINAPAWKAESDGASGQVVRLVYSGDSEVAMVTWSRNGQVYLESPGIGKAMKSGFAIVVFDDEYIETYVYNAGTAEMLFSQLRSGSAVLPNVIKAFRGTCGVVGSR